MTTLEIASAAIAMERARARWELTGSRADWTAYVEAENRWLKARLAAEAPRRSAAGDAGRDVA